MNLLTLRFNDLLVEHEFLNRKNSQDQHSQPIFRLFLIALLTLQVLGNILDEFWLETIINSTGLLIMLIGYIFKQKLTSIDDPLTFLIILSYNLQHPFRCVIYQQTSFDQIFESYFISQGTLGIISTWSYGQKTTLSFLILIVHIIYLGLLAISWRMVLILFISTSAIIYSYYYQELKTRIEYIALTNVGIIEENLYQQIDINSYIVQFNYKENLINLVRQNSNIRLTEIQQQQFISFLRNMKVILFSQRRRKSIIQSSQMMGQQNKINLEQLIFYMFANQEKLEQITKNCTKDNKIFEVIGLIGLDVYHIKLIKSFDVKPSLILLIKENKKESQSKQLKYQLKTAYKLLNEVQNSLQSRIRLCLIFTKQIIINQIKAKQNQVEDYSKLIGFLNSQLTKFYNDMNNIYEFHTLNTKSNQIVIRQFDINQCVEECLQVFNLTSNHKRDYQKINLRSNLKDKLIFSDQKKFKQLILNCLFYILKTAKPIRVELNDILKQDTEFIKVEIFFFGQVFTAEKIAKLPILNPQSLQELKHNSQQQLSLEIPIALMIIRQIGPYNQLKQKLNKLTKQNSLVFYIFKNLEEYNLIPIVSLHPSENLITQKNQQRKVKSGYKTLNLIPIDVQQNIETRRQQSEKMILQNE